MARDTPPEVLRVHLLDLANRLQARARQFEDGEVIAEPGASSLPVRWSMLGRLAGKLEALAHKQLRAEPWTPEEVTFLKDYGKKLANVMGYFGNAYLSPEDDAPRWAEVCAYPDRGTSLIAAVGRPRMIYVLYPWNGVDILCRGSVMQYYEFESAEKMTDREWRDRLDAPECPALPEWIAAIAGPPRLERQREGE